MEAVGGVEDERSACVCMCVWSLIVLERTLRVRFGVKYSGCVDGSVCDGVLCVICGMRYVLHGVWCVVCGVWYVVCGMGKAHRESYKTNE